MDAIDKCYTDHPFVN